MIKQSKDKPNCGQGQPCGDSCIAKADSCIAFVAKASAQGLLQAAKAADKVQLASSTIATGLSFTFPMELALDGDAVVSVVSETLAYSARQIIAAVRLKQSRAKATKLES